MILKLNLLALVSLASPISQNILPGINTIPDEKWALMEKDSTIQYMIDEGTLEIVAQEEKKSVKEGEKPHAPKSDIQLILEMPTAKAKKMAKETGDRNLLAAWLEKETRPEVQDLIKAQQKAIADIKYRKA